MRKILVVDDSHFNLLVVQQALEAEYEVATAISGKDGIEYAKNHTVDLILLDIEMPEIDGISTMKVLKRHPKTAQIPIIFLTGVADHDIERICLDLGARDFITKPFNEPVMRQRIKLVLELEDLRKNLEREVKSKTEQLERLTAEIIATFANSKDHLTGLWSRLYLEHKVASVLDDFELTGAMAVLDIDNFRVVNEALGYEQGNRCLQVVAEGIKRALDEEDIAARCCADKFLIYFPSVALKEEVEAKVMRLLDAIDENLVDNKFQGVTLSVGMAMNIEAGNSFNEVFFAAEKAMHDVKVTSKGGVAFYSMNK